jgi:hypothetical protein
MDTDIRDLHAQINALNILLGTLYTNAYKSDPQGLRLLEDRLTTQLRQPPRFPNPLDQDQALEIQPVTLSALWVFFREVESSIQKELTE